MRDLGVAGTDVLSKYLSERKYVQKYSDSLGASVTVKSHDIVGSFSYNIFVGVFVATIFGAAFFFDLFWPERNESRSVRIAWKACAVLSCIFTLSSAILLTVILSTKRAVLVGNYTGIVFKLDPPLQYKENGESIASVVLIWLGWIATCAATGLMFSSINHNERYGSAKSGHLRDADAPQKESSQGASIARPDARSSPGADVDSEKDAERL